MTLKAIQAFVVSVDPNADHYESAYREGDPYTIWYEQGPLPFVGDGEYLGAIKFVIARITKEENDPVVAALTTALEESDTIAYDYKPDYDPETGYILHIFDCEGA